MYLKFLLICYIEAINQRKRKNMKKLFVFSLLFLVSACAQGSIYKKYDQDCNSHFYSRKDCPAKKETAKAPEKVYVYKEARPQPRRITLVAQQPVYAAPRPAPVVVPVTAVSVPAAVTTIDVQAPAPVPAPVVVNNNGCTGCAPVIRQTREPVEVIYKKTTYTTVYEPKTTSTVSYEKEPVINQKIITNTQVVAQPEVKTVVTSQPEVKTVVTTQPQVKTVVTTTTKPAVKKVSYTIENTQTTAPSELLIEEIK